jgi:hypothetical protein
MNTLYVGQLALYWEDEGDLRIRDWDTGVEKKVREKKVEAALKKLFKETK